MSKTVTQAREAWVTIATRAAVVPMALIIITTSTSRNHTNIFRFLLTTLCIFSTKQGVHGGAKGGFPLDILFPTLIQTPDVPPTRKFWIKHCHMLHKIHEKWACGFILGSHLKVWNRFIRSAMGSGLCENVALENPEFCMLITRPVEEAYFPSAVFILIVCGLNFRDYA